MGHLLLTNCTVHVSASMGSVAVARQNDTSSEMNLFIQFFLVRKTSKLKLSYVDFLSALKSAMSITSALNSANVTSYMHGH